jgi:predicted metal-binding membrane protein
VQRDAAGAGEVAVLLILAAGAWAATIALARGMAGTTGTMGLGLAAFVAIWTLMMAAMMLPSVAPTASLYAKTCRDNRAVRIAGLVAAISPSGRRPACPHTDWPGSLAG